MLWHFRARFAIVPVAVAGLAVTLAGHAQRPVRAAPWTPPHWEGRTLVVDTINFTDKTEFRGASDRLHLVERFTRVDADTIDYRFTADDPATWTRECAAAVQRVP